jgi:hypothetical protein
MIFLLFWWWWCIGLTKNYKASTDEPDWKRAFWGTNYPRLEAIKRKVDPANVFWCSPCVGSDQLTYDDERICRNANYSARSFGSSSSSPAPSTYPNEKSKTGIASLPGDPPIPHPMIPIIMTWSANGTLPPKMLKSNYFKIAMGEGGSAGGKFRNYDPYNEGKMLDKNDW